MSLVGPRPERPEFLPSLERAFPDYRRRLAVRPGVTGLAVGDPVMGLLGVVGPEAVVDARLLTVLPPGWSLVQAAGAPAVYLTALYALSVLAGVKAGQQVLIHAATGGVGMAAVALARHWGLEVFATASRGKWDTLRAMGFDDDLSIAAHKAVREMVDFLVTEKHLSRDDAYMLTSVAGDVDITELVDRNKGVHVMMPKAIFAK